MQVQEAQRVPIMMDAKRPIPRHIIIKTPKVKDKEIIKIKRKEVSYGKVARWEREGENGRRGEGIKKYKKVVAE